MIAAQRLPNGDLLVPTAVDDGDTLLDGYRLLLADTPEWRSWQDEPTVPAVVRPTGQEHFEALTEAEQDELLGADVAAAVRAGDVTLEDLAKRRRIPGGLGFLITRPDQEILED